MPRYRVTELRCIEVEAPDESRALDAADESDWEQHSKITIDNISDMSEGELAKRWGR